MFTGRVLFVFVAKTLLLPGFIQFSAPGYHCPATARYQRNIWLLLGQGLFWLGLAVSTIGTGRWQLLAAAFLGLQVLAVLNVFKIAMEHGGDRSRAPESLFAVGKLNFSAAVASDAAKYFAAF